jgi:hypothetical protein
MSLKQFWLWAALLAAAGGTLWLSRQLRYSPAPRPAAAAPVALLASRSAVPRPRAARVGPARKAPDPEAIERWSDADPAGLTAYAFNLPLGSLRSLALACALPKWIAQDAVAASAWLADLPPDPDLDPGVVALARLPELPEHRPQVSIEWAVGIMDADARDATLQNIAERWARVAPEGLTKFLSGEDGLLPADRESLALGALIAAAPPGQRGL